MSDECNILSKNEFMHVEPVIAVFIKVILLLEVEDVHMIDSFPLYQEEH